MTDIERVAVVGAGTMGHGIAQVAALSGREVRLTDVSAAAAEAGLARVRANLDKGVSLGKVEPADRDGALSRLSVVVDLTEAVAGADLVIEAVPERPEVKEAVLSHIGRAADAEATVATNTSSMSIAMLARHVPDPGRVLGLHFFNPVHIMRLVEVVRGPESDPDRVADAVAFARSLGKEPIVVRDSPGFASSRLGVALGLEAIRMVEQEVASPEDIDTAMVLGYRHPMGPLRLTDLVGLDVRLGIAETLHRDLGDEHFRPPALLRRLVAEGKLGRKTGEGFYRWDEEESA